MIYDNEASANLILEEVIVGDVYLLRPLMGRQVKKVFDIGANYGTFAIFARMLFPNAAIYCFEPSPTVFEGLKENIRNLRINAYQVALGDGGGARMEVNPSNTCSGLFKTVSGDQSPSRPFADLIELTGTTIDESSIVKIDCEGGEAQIYNDEAAKEALGRSLHFCMETHYAENGFFSHAYPIDDWAQWARGLDAGHPGRRTRYAKGRPDTAAKHCGMIWSTAS